MKEPEDKLKEAWSGLWKNVFKLLIVFIAVAGIVTLLLGVWEPSLSGIMLVLLAVVILVAGLE